MSKSKSYNRIVFLTTLSVYLGLVLVGGTAPVLAHSALTKSFDIKNEVEFKDDLDNKPDNEEIESTAKSDFPALFEQVLNEIRRNSEDRSFVLPIQTGFQLQKNQTFVRVDVSNAFHQNLSAALQNSVNVLLKNDSGKLNTTQFAKFLEHKFSAKPEDLCAASKNEFYENADITSQNNQIFIVTRLPRAGIDSFPA